MFAAAERCLTAEARDMPFSLTYLFEDDGKIALRVSQTNFEAAHSAAPERIAIEDTAPHCSTNIKAAQTPSAPAATIGAESPAIDRDRCRSPAVVNSHPATE